MSFTISYNIKAIDKYSKVALYITEVNSKLENSFDKIKKSSAKVARAYSKLDGASVKLKDTSEKLNNKVESSNRNLEKAVSESKSLKSATDKLNASKKSLAKTEKKLATKNREYIANMRKQGQFMSNVGGIAIRAAVPVLGLGIAAGKVAMDFETAMVEIQKVTSKAVSKEMEIRIRDMAKTIPIAQTELAGMAADAARFGIRGSENIDMFTRAVAKMSIATDLTTEEAGVSFAKINELTGLSAKQTENLGSAINTLSNNYATSAGEIVQSMLRSSAAASSFGLSATEIAGLSAQINAVSESAERGGTRMRTLFMELQNPKKVESYAKAIGMTAYQFEALQKSNPAAALFSLVDAIDQNGQAARNLRKVAGSESVQALAAMAKNTDKTKMAMIEAKQSFIDNTSLQKEFGDASKTTAMKIVLLKNKIKELAIKHGPKLLETAERIIKKIGKFVDWLDKLDPATLETAASIAFFALKAGLLLKVMGSLNLGVASITEMLPGVGSGADGASKGVGTLAKSMKALNIYVLAVATAYTALKGAWDIWEERGQKKVDARQSAFEAQNVARIDRKNLSNEDLKANILKEKSYMASLPTSDIGAAFESPDKMFQTFASNFSDKVARPIDEAANLMERSKSRIALFEQELEQRRNGPRASENIDSRLKEYQMQKSDLRKLQTEMYLKIDVNDPGGAVNKVSAKPDKNTKLDVGGNFK